MKSLYLFGILTECSLDIDRLADLIIGGSRGETIRIVEHICQLLPCQNLKIELLVVSTFDQVSLHNIRIKNDRSRTQMQETTFSKSKLIQYEIKLQRFSRMVIV